jgi:hypothetical protein
MKCEFFLRASNLVYNKILRDEQRIIDIINTLLVS